MNAKLINSLLVNVTSRTTIRSVAGSRGFLADFNLLNVLNNSGNFIVNAIGWILTLFMRLLILVGRFMLNIVEFLFVVIRNILGNDASFDGLESLENDKIFQFVLSDSVLGIIRRVLVIGIILLIIFSIVAIIRTEIRGALGDKNSKKQVLVSALKSLFLMVLVPLIFIVSIIFTDVIFTSIYNATAGGENISLGMRIWQASTYQANAFRHYADNNQRIPITLSFSNSTQIDAATGEIVDINYDEISIYGTVAQLQQSYDEFVNQSGFVSGYAAYLMFSNKNYYSISEVAAFEDYYFSQTGEHSAYFQLYDSNLMYNQNEYYVMADVIDYCLVNNTKLGPFYYKSINDVYLNWQSAGADLTQLPISFNGSDYEVSIRYASEKNAKIYSSPSGTYDESAGTVFTICYAQTYVDPSGVIHIIDMPIINGRNNFHSENLSGTGSMIIAKGIFDRNDRPTAIRVNANGDVEFYRENPYAPSLFDFFPTITYELPEGYNESGISMFARSTFTTITGLSADQYIPYIYFNADQISAYTKKTDEVALLHNGEFSVTYSMTNSIDGDFKNYNVYDEESINVFILILASIALIQTLISIIFGVIGRIFDMVVLAITYPGVVGAMPLDNGVAFKKWTGEFVDRLFSIFGIALTLNVVLILIPIAWDFDFITAEMVANNRLLTGFRAGFLNILIKLAFTMVGISMIHIITRLLNFLLGSMSVEQAQANLDKAKILNKTVWSIINDPKSTKGELDMVGASGIIDAGKEILDDSISNLKFAGDVVSGRKLLSDIKQTKQRLADYTGVSLTKNAINEVRNGTLWKKGLKEHDATMRAFSNDLRSGAVNDAASARSETSSFMNQHKKDMKELKQGAGEKVKK